MKLVVYNTLGEMVNQDQRHFRNNVLAMEKLVPYIAALKLVTSICK